MLTIYCEVISKPVGWSSSWNSDCLIVWGVIGSGVYNKLIYVIHVDENNELYIEIINYVGSATNVIIPDTINVNGEEIPVIKIGDNSFIVNDTIISVTIGKNVTTIGDSAFYGCSSLTSIVIPDSVTSIGSDAFSRCYDLTTVTIGKDSKLTAIGSSAFFACSSLTSIVIPSSVTTIGSNAFKGCYKLTIYCEATSKPIFGWVSSWNDSNRPVVWGYKR